MIYIRCKLTVCPLVSCSTYSYSEQQAGELWHPDSLLPLAPMTQPLQFSVVLTQSLSLCWWICFCSRRRCLKQFDAQNLFVKLYFNFIFNIFQPFVLTLNPQWIKKKNPPFVFFSSPWPSSSSVINLLFTWDILLYPSWQFWQENEK